MSSEKIKCLIILSYKSSGSSSLQQFLTKFTQAKHISKTRHYENETLYWTKAASVLNLKQIKMLDSEVPIPKQKARIDLINLLKENLGSYEIPEDDYKLIFEGWELLCQKFGPVFIEKSPHHLCQWSALGLIAETPKRLPKIDFCIIGLIRNPMDTLYSAWKRWKISPEKCQHEWLLAYRNLIKFKDIYPGNFHIIRYEDMIEDLNCLRPILDFISADMTDNLKSFFHSKSLAKWKEDRLFGFNLAPEIKQFASTYGYRFDEMSNEVSSLWPLYRNASRQIYKCLLPAKNIYLRFKG